MSDTARLDEVLETQDPISGSRGGLLDFHTWIETTGGWVVWLGSLGIAVWVVDKAMTLVGGGGIFSGVSGFLGRLMGKAPAAPAQSAAGAPAVQAQGETF